MSVQKEFCLKVVLVLFSFATLCVVQVPRVLAGDDYVSAPYHSVKDAPMRSGGNWSGLYVGAHAGLVTGSTEGALVGGGIPVPLSAEYDLDGALIGGHLGYNLQTGSWVWGIEGTFSGGNTDGTAACVIFLTCARELNWMATVEGRLGYAVGNTLVYARGGVAWGELDTEIGIFGVNFLTASETNTGWTAGFGLEHMIGNALIARIEYAHTDFGDEQHNLAGAIGPIPVDVEAEIDTLRLGVSYKFGN